MRGNSNIMLFYWLFFFPMIAGSSSEPLPLWAVHLIMGILGVGILFFVYFFIRYCVPLIYKRLKKEYNEKEWLYK
jgi:Kef-type K+ transport system membrane component KefB